MPPDPMDSLPTDHGSDRYDHVELDAPVHLQPAGEWWDQLLETPCPDCRANLFVRWRNRNLRPDDRDAWHVSVAHDDACPVLRRLEAGS